MRYISLFSGIEAASVAWHGDPLNWEPICFSEIEAFPRAVLQHHYPDVPLHGDMTQVDWSQYRGQADVVVAGAPCTAFSVAGLRQSLDDDRGTLTLATIKALNEIRPAVFVFENVPGILNTKDNAFGCFLAALVGADSPLVPTDKRGRWTNAGVVSGPERRAAWRILDAQYTGVAQRRRRVFVVGCPRDGADPAQILFESESLQRHPPTRPKAGQEAAGDAGEGAPICHATETGVGFWNGNVLPNLRACAGTSSKPMTMIGETTRSQTARYDSSEDGTGRGVPLVSAYSISPGSVDKGKKDDLHVVETNVSRTLNATPDPTLHQGGDIIVVNAREDPIHCSGNCSLPLGAKDTEHAIAYGADLSQKAEGTGFREEQSPCVAPGTHPGHGNHVVAFQSNGSGLDATEECCPTLRSGARDDDLKGHHSTANAKPAICFDVNQITHPENRSNPQPGDASPPLVTYGSAPHIVGSFQQSSFTGVGTAGYQEGEHPLRPVKPQRDHQMMILPSMQVRRLLPEECEKLQGFPPGYTRIPWRNKAPEDCPDGPRYKGIGNSMAVPCMLYIGQRIQQYANSQEAL